MLTQYGMLLALVSPVGIALYALENRPTRTSGIGMDSWAESQVLGVWSLFGHFIARTHLCPGS